MAESDTAFVADLESNESTQLERLGSEKALIAATRADLSTETILRTVAAKTAAIRDLYADWAAEAEGEVAAAFEDAAEAAGSRYDRLAEDLGDEPEADGAPLADHLAAETDAVEQVAGGLVAYPLVTQRTYLQAVSFFVNEADEARADRFRAFRSDAADRVSAGAALLEEICVDDGDWNRAEAAASALIDVAYEDYASTLEGLGMDPKPVC